MRTHLSRAGNRGGSTQEGLERKVKRDGSRGKCFGGCGNRDACEQDFAQVAMGLQYGGGQYGSGRFRIRRRAWGLSRSAFTGLVDAATLALGLPGVATTGPCFRVGFRRGTAATASRFHRNRMAASPRLRFIGLRSSLRAATANGRHAGSGDKGNGQEEEREAFPHESILGEQAGVGQ